ncbi:MAG: hypothetical protein V1682_00740 [Candidatus Omnitrophota bacterium]
MANPGKKEMIFIDTIEGAARYGGAACPSAICIAVRPGAYNSLKASGVDAKNTLPYFDNDSHRNMLERSDHMLEWLRSQISFPSGGFGVKEAYEDSLVYVARCSLLHILWLIEIVTNAVNKHGPEEISALSSKEAAASSFFIEPEEGMLNIVVELAARTRGIAFKDRHLGRSPGDPIRMSVLHVRSLVRYMARYAKFKLWKRAMELKAKRGSRPPIFFTSKSYGMETYLKELRRELNGKSAYLLDGPVIPRCKIPDILIMAIAGKNAGYVLDRKNALNRMIGAVRDADEVFTYRGISFAKLLSEKIKKDIGPYIAGQFLWTVALDDLLDTVKPSHLVSNGTRPDDLILAELCRRKGIKDILISHGSHRRPADLHESIEWGEHGRALLRGPFSHLAMQTPVAEGYLETFPAKGDIMKTGPLIWGRPVRRMPEADTFKRLFGPVDRAKIKVLTHAGTSKGCNALRLYVYETPDEYLQSIRDLAAAVEKAEDAALVIRFRPSMDISLADLKEAVKVSDKVKISCDEPFRDILAMTDLLVSFSSTTIEEALQNMIPVLLYGGDGRYQHVSAYEIAEGTVIKPSAVYHVRSAQSLEGAIRKILKFDISKNANEDLFRPYRYDQDTRIPLSSIMVGRAGSDK